MCLNFRTAYLDTDGEIEFDVKKISSHYVSGWFTIDLVSSIPLDLFTNADQIDKKQARLRTLLRLLKLPRLLRIGRLFKYLERFKYAGTWKIFKVPPATLRSCAVTPARPSLLCALLYFSFEAVNHIQIAMFLIP